LVKRSNAALQQLAHATYQRGALAASPLQALSERAFTRRDARPAQ
jgi:hypothetical protein